MVDLPPHPIMDDQKPHLSTRPSKQIKHSSRSSKRTTSSHEHGAIAIDGRHKRVWKACERCRMKKTKCDGESPCKRCKDDGLVCTAGSRKKTEFKQLPRGYAEVLENTQYALIATVQKLYSMVRNNESWSLGEPEMNERGQPVIHDIASKLGCIRPSPDLPYAFPEGLEDSADLQAQMQAARSDIHSDDTDSRQLSQNSPESPALERTDRASSSESDHSNLSKDYNRMMATQHQAAQGSLTRGNLSAEQPRPVSFAAAPRCAFEEDGLDSYEARASTESTNSMPSPIFTDFQIDSPMLRTASPFSPWSGGDNFLGPPHALDLTVQFMQQQHQARINRSSPMNATGLRATGMEPDLLKMAYFEEMNFSHGDGTITPNMLNGSTGIEIFDVMDAIYSGDYESQIAMV